MSGNPTFEELEEINAEKRRKSEDENKRREELEAEARKRDEEAAEKRDKENSDRGDRFDAMDRAMFSRNPQDRTKTTLTTKKTANADHNRTSSRGNHPRLVHI